MKIALYRFVRLFCFLFSIVFSIVGCNHPSSNNQKETRFGNNPERVTPQENQKGQKNSGERIKSATSPIDSTRSISEKLFNKPNRGPLLSTWFKSLDELKTAVQIEYFKHRRPYVRLTHKCNGTQVVSILKSGLSELDITRARDGGLWDKIILGFNSPYLVLSRKDLVRIFVLSRRKELAFGEGDKAFYDLALMMVNNIEDEDLAFSQSEDLSEKGYLNTFNHVNAQAFMTSIFSEKLADFVADLHERRNMPELVTGNFSEKQLEDLEKGPTDNYVDIINNEWGQELGKRLSIKYDISRKTYWTPNLLANYLNEIQRYYSWAFQIGFKPVKPSDEIVFRFSNKLNSVMHDASELNLPRYNKLFKGTGKK